MKTRASPLIEAYSSFVATMSKCLLVLGLSLSTVPATTKYCRQQLRVTPQTSQRITMQPQSTLDSAAAVATDAIIQLREHFPDADPSLIVLTLARELMKYPVE